LHPLGHLDREELAFAASLVATEADRLRQILIAEPPGGDDNAPLPARPDERLSLWDEDNDIMCTIREILSAGPLSPKDLITQTAQAFGCKYVTQRVSGTLEGVLLAAARRKITCRNGGMLSLWTRSINGYEDEHLKTQYLAALRKLGTGWVEQDQVMRAFARRLGYSRTGASIAARGQTQVGKLRREKIVTISGSEIRLC
jgi:hypothetical protein